MNRLGTKAKIFAFYSVQAIVVGAIAAIALRLHSYDLRVPLNYWGDTLVMLMFIKGMLLNGWAFTIPQLSAPFGMFAAAFPVMSNFDWLLMKLISVFTSEAGLVLNGFWLLTLLLSAVASTIAMQLLGVGRIYAFGAGILYAFLPYAFLRNVSHISLVYYLVPLLGLLAVHIAAGLQSEKDRLIRCIGYAGCVAQGFDYVYYSFFAVLIFVFAAVLGYVSTRSRRVIDVAAIAMALTVGSTVVNLSPSVYNWFTSGKPPEMNYKQPAEAEIYGAKIRKLIAPHEHNRIPGFRKWSHRDRNNGYPNENENVAARLGLAASVGFLLLSLISLRIVRVPAGAQGDRLNALAPLSLFTLLFITVGGLGALFNLFFFSDIRAYNRFSVFLAFFALAGLGIGLRAWLPQRKTRRWLIASSMAVLFLLSLYDQLLDRTSLVSRQEIDAERYRGERKAVERLKAFYPTGATLLQLPLTAVFPHFSTHERMQSYDHLRPFLWSDANMKWSWPSFSGRHLSWQNRLATDRPDALVEAAVYSGFDAVWIDQSGYKDDARQLVSALEAAGATLKLNESGYTVLDLGRAKRELLTAMSESEFSQRQKMWLEAVVVGWDKGFYGEEKNPWGMVFRWSSRQSKLQFSNDSPVLKSVKVDFDVASEGAGTVLIRQGADSRRINSRAEPQHATFEFDIPPGERVVLSFEADVPRVNAPGDPRNLYFYVANLSVVDRPTVPEKTFK